MVDVCTHCECSVDKGAVKKYRLACRRISCPTCPEVFILFTLPILIPFFVLDIIRSVPFTVVVLHSSVIISIIIFIVISIVILLIAILFTIFISVFIILIFNTIIITFKSMG